MVACLFVVCIRAVSVKLDLIPSADWETYNVINCYNEYDLNTEIVATLNGVVRRKSHVDGVG